MVAGAVLDCVRATATGAVQQAEGVNLTKEPALPQLEVWEHLWAMFTGPRDNLQAFCK